MSSRLLGRALLMAAAYAYSATPMLRGADYVGASVCAECHKEQYEKESNSHHTHSLRLIEGSLVGTILLKDGHSPDNRLTYEQGANVILVQENGAPEDARLEWAFGAGVQGSTPVGHLGNQYFEHQFSYYSRIQALAPTFGHPANVSTPMAEMGILQDSRTIFRCFNCHSTGAQQGPDGPDLRSMLPGVQCERCHGPGSSHVKAATDGLPNATIRREVVNPGRLPAKAQIEICGQCHRLPTADMGDKPELADPVTVRFAPIGLLASRCFLASKRLSCLTCHDPHANALPRSDVAYSDKCMGCHANGGRPLKLCRRTQRQDCLPCHMRQASLGPYLRFTDHRIRVY